MIKRIHRSIALWRLIRELRAAHGRLIEAKTQALDLERDAREVQALARAAVLEVERADLDYQHAANALDRWEAATNGKSVRMMEATR
jgi:hypothetical protein